MVYKVQHTFNSEIIIPICAMRNNVDFIVSKAKEPLILTSDNVKCKAAFYTIANIVDLEADVKRIYKMSAWDFIKRWYENLRFIDSMSFIKMTLVRIKNDEQSGELQE